MRCTVRYISLIPKSLGVDESFVLDYVLFLNDIFKSEFFGGEKEAYLFSQNAMESMVRIREEYASKWLEDGSVEKASIRYFLDECKRCGRRVKRKQK